MTQILMFSANWCGPCKSIKTWIDKFSNVTVIDADEDHESVNRYGVRSIPTFVKLDQDGTTIDIRNGAMSEREFAKFAAEGE